MSKESNIFVPIKYTNAMKKLSLCLLIAACVKNDDKDEPILVTDIVMPAQTSFNLVIKSRLKHKVSNPVTILCSKSIGRSPTNPL